jgi:hypothetical protein
MEFFILAPSWSWVAVNCQVYSCFELLRDYGRIEARRLVEYVTAKLDTVSEDPYGQVCGGYLELRGKLFPCSSSMYTTLCNSTLDIRDPGSVLIGSSRYIDEKTSDQTCEEDHIFVLPIGYLDYPYVGSNRFPDNKRKAVSHWKYDYTGALILRSCNTAPQKTYKRVGCIIMCKDGEIPGTNGMKFPIDLLDKLQDEDLEVIRII